MQDVGASSDPSAPKVLAVSPHPGVWELAGREIGVGLCLKGAWDGQADITTTYMGCG